MLSHLRGGRPAPARVEVRCSLRSGRGVPGRGRPEVPTPRGPAGPVARLPAPRDAGFRASGRLGLACGAAQRHRVGRHGRGRRTRRGTAAPPR
ncbi:MAG: hypothetical protein MZW92_42225 [Comamonadaceae bacterium]|nr:hypothetical protein [Comamonadaceae bacterium]